MKLSDFSARYIERLRRVDTEADVHDLYSWFWELRDEIPTIAAAINLELGLRDDYELKPDLPCIAIGSLRGLVLVSANPGWIASLNAKENARCRVSQEAYRTVMSDFFDEHPRVVGERVRWWSQPIGLLSLLENASKRIGVVGNGETRWRTAHRSRLIGGWELHPFHSSSDELTQRREIPWVRTWLTESLAAILRIGPEILFVASKTGYELMRELRPELAWSEKLITDTRVAYARTGSTEIIIVGRQMFSAKRKFKNAELIQAINHFRSLAAH
jgi:hypothetical protein